ncbi:MAG: glycosyltransferase family 4 protein [Hyphomicrobium sp.]
MAETRPTILQIIPELDTGGAELSTIEIADAVHSAGGRCIVLTEGGRLVQRLRDAGAEVYFFPAASKNPIRLLWNAHRIASIVRREHVSLIHARSRAPAWSGLIAARRTGIPFVTTYHGAYSEKSDLKRLYNSVMARGDVVIANSHYTADLIRMRYGTPRAKLRVIYRGVDGRLFDPVNVAEDRVAAVRRRWGVDDKQRVVLHAARLTPWKGQPTVINAAQLLAQRGLIDDVVFILAGDAQRRGAYRASLVEQIGAAGLDDRVRIVGHEDDMAAAFRASHVAVVASVEPEAFGRAATEAQVMATPVIATDIGAPPETVRGRPGVSPDQATGWLVPPEDASSLADAVAEALAMPDDERTRIGQRAREHVLKSFSLRQMKQQTLQVYDELLGTRLAARDSPSPA